MTDIAHFQPKDYIALFTIIGIVFLKLNGFNGYLDAAFGIIIGYYFVKRQDGIDKGI